MFEADPNTLLSYPMSWRWKCPNGHVALGVDLGTDDETVEALWKEGELVALKRTSR